MQNIAIKNYEDRYAQGICNLIKSNLLEVNNSDYELEAMERVAALYSEKAIKEKATTAHMYVWLDLEETIVGCGAIAPLDGSREESILSTIFVLPQYHSKGIGTQIVETLEEDEYGQRATRIEVASSVTAFGFYEHMGYVFKEGKKQLDEDGLYHMEKFVL